MFRTPLVAALLLTAPALAQTDLNLLRPWPEDGGYSSITAQTLLFADSDTDNPGPNGGDADFDLNIYQLSGRVRLDTSLEHAPALGFRLKYLDLNTNDAALPERLVDQAVAVGLPLGEWEGWEFGLIAGLGYAGDTPFDDADAIYGLATVSARTQLDEKSSLTLLLRYDGNSNIFPDVPLPGIAYARTANEQLSYTVGVPVSTINWTPDDKLTIRVAYLLIDTFIVGVDYELTEDWTLFALFDSSTDAFKLETQDHDRLFFTQRRVEGGARWQPLPQVELIAAAGFAFSQEFNVGFDARDLDEVAEVEDTPYLRLGLRVEY